MAAFVSAIVGRSIFGNKRITWGTYTPSGGSTGGAINTGLRLCEFLCLQSANAAITADAPTVNGTLPLPGGAITIICTADKVGTWWAFGIGQ